MGQTNNCRGTFSCKLMTLGTDMQIAVGAAVRGCCCGCEGAEDRTGQASRPGLPAACTFSSSMINCFDNFGLCRHHFQIPCQARRSIRGKMQTENGATHTHLPLPPFPCFPRAIFVASLTNVAKIDVWFHAAEGGTARLSASGGREACKIYSRCRFSRNSASFALL